MTDLPCGIVTHRWAGVVGCRGVVFAPVGDENDTENGT